MLQQFVSYTCICYTLKSNTILRHTKVPAAKLWSIAVSWKGENPISWLWRSNFSYLKNAFSVLSYFDYKYLMLKILAFHKIFAHMCISIWPSERVAVGKMKAYQMISSNQCEHLSVNGSHSSKNAAFAKNSKFLQTFFSFSQTSSSGIRKSTQKEIWK